LLQLKVVLEDFTQSNNQTTQISEVERILKIIKELNESSLQNSDHLPSLVSSLLDLCYKLYVQSKDQVLVAKVTAILKEIAKEFIIQHIHPQTHLLEMKNIEGRTLMRNIPRDIVNTVFYTLIENENITFPFKKFFEAPLKELFSNLQNYSPIISTQPYQLSSCKMTNDLFPPLFDSGYISLSNLASNYQRIDLIGDYFTEEQRLKGIRSDQPLSPMDYWKTHFLTVYIFLNSLSLNHF
jgi:hypothetical protein